MRKLIERFLRESPKPPDGPEEPARGWSKEDERRSVLGAELERQELRLLGWLQCPHCGSDDVDLITRELDGVAFSEGETQSYFRCSECGADTLGLGRQPRVWQFERD